IFISLPAFELQEDECITKSDRWIYVLKNMETLDRIPFTDDIPAMRRLEKTITIASMDPNQRGLYEASVKAYRDNLAVISYKVKEGIAEGEARSRAKVEAAEAKAQKAEADRMQDKIDIARNFKRLGTPVEIIMQATGLSHEAIERM
ncbi:MAG: Rpn family recombination-promoting nuclease/putative transposase, partial [Prevotellaceae bacterium]|nr:Rpn family recombination-promoting nuclease/putative transposase [Prevotellaceae bacterium]